jgi:hypothetical protein
VDASPQLLGTCAPLMTLPLARHCRSTGQKMVSRDHKLSMRKQCELLQLSRSRLYYQPVGESAENLRFMEIIDKQFLETPWCGSRQPLGTFPAETPCRSMNGPIHEAQ